MIAGRRRSMQIEKRYVRRDGSALWVSLSASIVHDNEGRPVAVVSQIQDLTAYKEAERQTTLLLEDYRDLYESQLQIVARLTGLYQAGLALTQAGSMDDLLNIIVRQAGRLIIGADAIMLSRYDQSGQLLVAAVEGLPASIIGARVPMEQGLSGRAVSLRRMQRVSDYSTWEHRVEAGLTFGFRSGVALPLVWQERVMGALAVVRRQTGQIADEDVNVLTLFGTLAAAGLALRGAYEDAHRREVEARELARQLASARDDERNQIAERLHNTIGHSLSLLQKSLITVCHPPSGEQPAPETLPSAMRLLNQVSEQVRALVMDLDSQVLDESGVAAAARRYVEHIAVATQQPIRFHTTGRIRRMPIQIERVVFRGLKEALNNAVRHAQAREISAQLHIGANTVRLTVQDDGIGFDPSLLDSNNGPAHSFGLAGVRRQTRLLNGDFNVESAPGKGTTVIIEIPVPAELIRDGERMRVLIAEGHDITRRGIAAALCESGEYECIEASDGFSALHQAQMNRPDIALVDVDLPEMAALSAVRQIAAVCEHALIVLLLSHNYDEQFVERAMQAGVHGLVLKSASSQELLQALRTVRAGELVVPPRLVHVIPSSTKADLRRGSSRFAHQTGAPGVGTDCERLPQ